MPFLDLLQDGERRTLQVQTGQTILEVLQAHGIPLTSPCGGNHACGKCRVEASGGILPPDVWERRLLTDAGGRLACFAEIYGDCAVQLPSRRRQQIASGYEVLERPTDPLYPGEYGIAADIGTTTVVVYLFQRESAQPLTSLGQANAQQSCGSDVLSRISYCDRHTVAPLQNMICAQLAEMIRQLCEQAHIRPEEISGGCIAGNTTMLHLLTGLDPHSIGAAPFRPASLFGGETELTLPGLSPLVCCLPPCISAYVGGDITCGILASGIMERPETVLLIDAGTNGEIVLKHKGRLYCCSTAAGPAFEGAKISCGMQAQCGAIHRVWTEDGELRFSVLGQEEPLGLCGSGLVDAVSAARSAGLLDKRGRPRDGMSLPVGSSGVALTYGDIQELLLAKAAIRAGIDTLLQVCGCSAGAVEKVLLCGGFGSYLDANSALGIGMLPEQFRGRTRAAGNAAGMGAGIVLQDRRSQQALRRIVSDAETVDLSGNPMFFKNYIASMFLP